MKRAIVVIALMFFAVVAFAAPSGSITNTTAYDADTGAVVETLDTSVVIGPLTLGNKLVIGLLPYSALDWTGKFTLAVSPAVSLGIETAYGQAGILPMTFKASWTVTDRLAVNGKWVHADLASGGLGVFTAEGKYTF